MSHRTLMALLGLLLAATVGPQARAASHPAEATEPAPRADVLGHVPQPLAALATQTNVEAVLWSGSLPSATDGLQAFVGARGQHALAQAVARLRQQWQVRLGFDPLDATALRRAGLRPDQGVALLQLRGERAAVPPLIMVAVGDKAAWQRALLANLAEEEGAGTIVSARSSKGRAYQSLRRRFGGNLRNAGAEASVAPGWVALAPAGAEAALLALLDAAASDGAGAAAGAGDSPGKAASDPAPRAPLPLGPHWTLWRRQPGVANLTAQWQLGAKEALGFVTVRPATPLAGAPTGGKPGLQLAPAAAAATPALADVFVGDVRPYLARLDADGASKALRRGSKLLPEPLAGPTQALLGKALDLEKRLASRDLAQLRRILGNVAAAAWLELVPQPPASAVASIAPQAPSRPLAVAAALRVDDDKAAAAITRFWRGRCGAGAGASTGTGTGTGTGTRATASQRASASPPLRCLVPLETPRGRALHGQLDAAGGQQAVDLVWAPPFLLLADTAAATARLAARLPATGAVATAARAATGTTAATAAGAAALSTAPTGKSLNAAAPTAAARTGAALQPGAVAFPAALAAAAVLPQAGGSLSFAVAADLFAQTLVPASAQALGGGILGKLLLAGPLGDVVREVAALGQLDWRLREADGNLYVALRLQAGS